MFRVLRARSKLDKFLFRDSWWLVPHLIWSKNYKQKINLSPHQLDIWLIQVIYYYLCSTIMGRRMKEENPRIIVLNLFEFMITFAESSDFYIS